MPLVFILSAGADLMSDLLALADALRFAKRFEKVRALCVCVPPVPLRALPVCVSPARVFLTLTLGSGLGLGLGLALRLALREGPGFWVGA